MRPPQNLLGRLLPPPGSLRRCWWVGTSPLLFLAEGLKVEELGLLAPAWQVDGRLVLRLLRPVEALRWQPEQQLPPRSRRPKL